MFRKLDVPVLGVVENMSYALCECGRLSHPFGRGGGGEFAARSGVPLLGEVPFEESVVAGEDRGLPPLLEDADGTVARVTLRVASRTMETLYPAPSAVPDPR